MLDPLLQLADHVDRDDGPVVIAAEGSQDGELASGAHSHARGQLFGSLRGLLSVGVEDGVWIVPAIHAVWLPPHQRHSGRSHGPFHGWSVYVAESACADLPPRPCTIRTSGLLREAVLRAASWPLQSLPLDGARAHVAALILDEIRHLPVEPFGLPLPSDPRLQRIAKALIADPADARDLEAWAAWAAVSSRTLSRRFVAETGFNFTAWRQRARMMRSLEMLAAGMPVTAIALDLGYATASAFIGLFRRTFGETPAVYRTRL
ncbi:MULTISPECIES: helix-turn-helix transcriptional regulator [unclassified Variovorax]|uniref:AraC family transcriptional regulator n=1 Tax=unclassified Variovorax TaxID=663243 RepID=UPI0025791A9A|nr:MULTISPECIES: helix-turn-helix transcriptional regulator [unclassified Variovorax]MDM0091388.1 helix-turn-helix transcriptional regulator [Variovorax sp. J22G40]MDM0149586.1 helix-turn-helix transcriptional regulator [Variovorax sp. J2P1-31]